MIDDADIIIFADKLESRGGFQWFFDVLLH